jgi:hypothetical protein
MADLTPDWTMIDASGLISVSRFTRTATGTPQNHWIDFSIPVPDDMIVIGGGGIGAEFPNGVLLTASYPNSTLSSWLISTKDHIGGYEQPHLPTGFALGLKIKGFTRAQLSVAVQFRQKDSSIQSHPEMCCSIVDGTVLLGGGARMNWDWQNNAPGSLLTASYPSGFDSQQPPLHWCGKGKDHDGALVDPTSISVFAITLSKNFQSIGMTPITQCRQALSTSAEHPGGEQFAASLDTGFVITGGGAFDLWSTQGGLLWRLEPQFDPSTNVARFVANAKDHGGSHAEKTILTTYAVGLQFQKVKG